MVKISKGGNSPYSMTTALSVLSTEPLLAFLLALREVGLDPLPREEGLEFDLEFGREP